MSKVSVIESETENWGEDRKISVCSGNQTRVHSIHRQALYLYTTIMAHLLQNLELVWVKDNQLSS